MIEDNTLEEEASSATMDDPPDQSTIAGDSEFVEVDQTGRYGRYNEVLGKGAFKTVYRAFDEEDGIEVAWNQVKIQDILQSPEDLERLYSEVHLLKSLKHKNIIKFYHSWVDTKNRNVNFITEIFTSGTLRQYRKKHKHVDIKAVKNWARQILRGLLYLHSHDPPIIHRDVKCDNIFVNGNNGEVKIGDLGLATILRQAHAAHSVIGTPEFMAPELYEEEYNELVDIYSFGMCLLEMVTFEYPYSECTNAAQIYKKVTTGKRPAALERVKDAEVRQFIEKCLAAASRRLPARELLKDPFLQSDTGRDFLESLPLLPIVKPVGDDMDDLIGKDSRCEYASSNINVSHGGKLGLFSFSDSNKDSDLVYAQVLPSPKDDHQSGSRDFRVKGKKRDENTVFLRLRIVDAQGHVSNIHFLFDIEGDTALSVASEMVAELDLSDQDVTNIADMIDQEILGLVPEWKPGASFDDSADPEEWGEQVEQPLLDSFSGGAKANLSSVAELGDEALMSVHDSGKVPSKWKIQSPTFRRRAEGMMQSRIEEVTYGQGGSDCSPSSSDAHIMSTDSSEHHHGESHTYHADDLTSPTSDYTEKGVESMQTPCLNVLNALDGTKRLPTECGHPDSKLFNELVESQRNADNSMYTHETWKEIMNVTPGFEDHEKEHSRAVWPDCTLTDRALHEDTEWDDELKLLALRQEQELSDLRRKHEQAVLEVKNRWEKMSGSMLSCKLPSAEALSRSAISGESVSKVPDKADNIVAEQVTCLPSALKQEDGESFEVELKSEAKCPELVKESPLEAEDCSTHAQMVVLSQSTCVVDGVTNREVSSAPDLSCSVSGSESLVTSGSSSNLGTATPKVPGNSTHAVGVLTTKWDPCPNKTERVDSALRGRRDSYIDLYKTSGLEREKFGAAKLDTCTNEAGAQEGVSKASSSKVDPASDLKKEQLQKSIAELEAKTLEGLHRSRNGYLSSNSSKKPLGASSAQFLSTPSLTRPNDLKKA